MTAQEIITAAFQELGIVVSGGSPGTDDLAWGLGKFNRLLNTLSVNGVNIPYETEESFSLVAGTPSYAIGSGATFDTARPNSISRAFIREGSSDYPLSVKSIEEYWLLSQKSATGFPTRLYYQGTYPNGTIYLYLAPASTYALHIVSEKSFTTHTVATEEVSLPGQYEDFLVLKLAMAFAPRYGKAVSKEFALNLRNAEAAVVDLNLARQMKAVPLNVTGQTGGAYNVNSDEYD